MFLPLFLIPVTVLVDPRVHPVPHPARDPVEAAPGLRRAEAITGFLVDWFGDVRVLLTDRIQAANIRARLAEAIQDCLDAGCGTIVVVGHSGGTMVGYMTLADEAYEPLPVNTFVTHGQALTIGWRLGHFGDPERPTTTPTGSTRRPAGRGPRRAAFRAACAGTTSGRPTTRRRPAA